MFTCKLGPVQIGQDINSLPIWLIQGGAPDDDEDEDGSTEIEVDGDDEDGEDEDGEDGEDEDEEDDKPPAKKVAAKKAPAKAPAKKLPPKKFGKSVGKTPAERALIVERRARQDSDRQLRELRAKNETEAETRLREAEEAAEAKYKPVAVSSAARAALIEAGFKGDAARGVKLMDMSAIEIYDGEAVGIEDQIAAMQDEFPEMFNSEEEDDKPKPRKKVAKINPANRKPAGAGDKKKTSAEIIAEMYEEG